MNVSSRTGAVDVWTRNWKHVEQLFNYGSAVRKVMYTTNAIEAINSSLRKVTKKAHFLAMKKKNFWNKSIRNILRLRQ